MTVLGEVIRCGQTRFDEGLADILEWVIGFLVLEGDKSALGRNENLVPV